MKWETYANLANKLAEQVKTGNPGLANKLLSVKNYHYTTKAALKSFISQLENDVIKLADDAVNQDILKTDSDRMPSECIMDHLNVFSFLLRIETRLPDEKDDPDFEKKLGTQSDQPYGFFLGWDPAYKAYYDQLNKMHADAEKKWTQADYRGTEKKKGLLMLTGDTLDHDNRSTKLAVHTASGNLMDKVFGDLNFGFLQITRPTGSNEKFALEDVPNMTFGQVIRKSRAVLARNINFRNHNAFPLDQFFFAMDGYIRDGHRPEDMKDETEVSVIVRQTANLDLSKFHTVKGDDEYTPASFYAYMQDLISQPEQYEEKIKAKLGDRMSLATMNFLLRPEVKNALLQIKREPGNNLKFVKDIFIVLEKNGLTAHMIELEKHTSREPGIYSMEAIRQSAENNRKNPDVPFLGVTMVNQLKHYVHELALRGVEEGIAPKAPVKTLDGKPVPEEWQELEAYVHGSWAYMHSFEEYSKNPTQQTAYDLYNASKKLAEGIGTVFGDDQLMEDLRRDSKLAYKHYDQLMMKNRYGNDPAFGNASEIKEYHMMDDRLYRIPSLFERALCNLGIWLKHHSLDELTVGVLDNLNMNLGHSFDVKTDSYLMADETHDSLRTVLEAGVINLPKYFKQLRPEHQNDPVSPEVGAVLKTLALEHPEWRTENPIGDLKVLKKALGQMQEKGVFELALKENEKYLHLQVPADETQNAHLLLERCKKLFSDASFVKGLKDNLYFRNSWEMAEGHSFDDFLDRLNETVLSTDPFTLTPEISALVEEARRSMSIVFSASLDAGEKEMCQLFDIMMQIKRPENHFSFDDPINAREFMEMTDLFCESPLSAQLDPVIEDFNTELACAPEADRMKKVSKNIYEPKPNAGKHSFAEFAKLVFANGVQDELPYTLKEAWKMEEYNKDGQQRILSDNEAIYQTIMRYKQLANYLPYLGKMYTQDQEAIKGVSPEEVNKYPEKYRRGNFIMSNVVNLQAHDTMNSPAVEARYAADVISILGREFKATVGDSKLRKEFYKALSANVCFDERASDFTQFSAKRVAAQGTPAIAPEDGSLYFRTDEMELFARTQASSADSLMQAVLSVWGNIKEEYADIIPEEYITVDMVRPVMKRILVDGKLEIEKSLVTEKSLDNVLQTVREAGIFHEDYTNDEEIRKAIRVEMRGAGYVWEPAWSEASENEAMEYARKLLGFHGVSGWEKNHDRLLEELAGMPEKKRREELRAEQGKVKEKRPVRRGFADNAQRQQMEENLQNAEAEAQRNRWREMEGGVGFHEAEARTMEYGKGVRYESFQKLFKSLIDEKKLGEAIGLTGTKAEKEALAHIQEIRKLSPEDFATIFANAGTVQEKTLVEAAQRLMTFYKSRYGTTTNMEILTRGNNEKLFDAAFPGKNIIYPYDDKDFKLFSETNKVSEALREFAEHFQEAMPGFNTQDGNAARRLFAHLDNVLQKVDFMEKNHVKFTRKEALELSETVHSCAALMLVYMNPADRTAGAFNTLEDGVNNILKGVEFLGVNYIQDKDFLDLRLDLKAAARLSEALHQSPDQVINDRDGMLDWLKDLKLRYGLAGRFMGRFTDVKLSGNALDGLADDIRMNNKVKVSAENIRAAYGKFAGKSVPEPENDKAAEAGKKAEVEPQEEQKPEEQLQAAEEKKAEPKPDQERKAEPKQEQEQKAEPKLDQERKAEPKQEQEQKAEPKLDQEQKPEVNPVEEMKPEQDVVKPKEQPEPAEASKPDPEELQRRADEAKLLAVEYPMLEQLVKDNEQNPKKIRAIMNGTLKLFEHKVPEPANDQGITESLLVKEQEEYNIFIDGCKMYLEELRKKVDSSKETDPVSIRADLHHLATIFSSIVNSQVGSKSKGGYLDYANPRKVLGDEKALEHLINVNMFCLYEDLFRNGILPSGKEARVPRIAMPIVYAQAAAEWKDAVDKKNPEKQRAAEDVLLNYTKAKERMQALLKEPAFITMLPADHEKGFLDKINELLGKKGAELLGLYNQKVKELAQERPEQKKAEEDAQKNLQEDVKKNVDLQDDVKKNVDLQEDVKKNVDLQEDVKKNVDLQNDKKENAGLQGGMKENYGPWDDMADNKALGNVKENNAKNEALGDVKENDAKQEAPGDAQENAGNQNPVKRTYRAEDFKKFYIRFIELKEMLERTDGITSGSPSYKHLKEVIHNQMARFDPELIKRMNNGEAMSLKDLRKLSDVLRNVAIAGEDYMKEHTPKGGKFSKASLSSTQLKRLSIISQFRQLKQQLIPGNDNYPDITKDIPDLAAADLCRERIALKLINAQAVDHYIEYADMPITNRKTKARIEAPGRKMLLDTKDGYRNEILKSLMEDKSFRTMLDTYTGRILKQAEKVPDKYDHCTTPEEALRYLANQNQEELLQAYRQVLSDWEKRKAKDLKEKKTKEKELKKQRKDKGNAKDRIKNPEKKKEAMNELS